LMSWITLQRMCVAMAKVKLNEKDIELEPLYAYVYENNLRLFEGWKLRYIAEILLNLDAQHLAESEDWIKRAIQTHKQDGMIWNFGKDYALYADVFKRKGNSVKARANLQKAIEIFKGCGADGWVARYEKELAALS
jgi:tetratricopeptide (TPR) repeat protein